MVVLVVLPVGGVGGGINHMHTAAAAADYMKKHKKKRIFLPVFKTHN